MVQQSGIYTFSSITQLMHFLGQPTPLHPLVVLVDYSKIPAGIFEKGQKISLDFYKISFKRKFGGQVRYGQGYYSFEEGGLAFLSPKQIIVSSGNTDSYEGYVLYFHPDFIRNSSLANSISRYGFFSYAVSEALFLSAQEKVLIEDLFHAMAAELEDNADQFSGDVLAVQLELLLNYSNRFYNRQFFTRNINYHESIHLLDKALEEYFDKDKGLKNGLPSVQYLSEQINKSPRYLSDLLRSLTGLNTQQYVQHKVIERAKNLLSLTAHSVSEIAYELGFEHPQSFSKLFKSKSGQTPSAYRQAFN